MRRVRNVFKCEGVKVGYCVGEAEGGRKADGEGRSGEKRCFYFKWKGDNISPSRQNNTLNFESLKL